MLISKIRVGKRFRKDIGELETLKNSIQEIGLLQPIVVDEKNNLIAGQRRLMACKELGWKEIDVKIVEKIIYKEFKKTKENIEKEFPDTDKLFNELRKKIEEISKCFTGYLSEQICCACLWHLKDINVDKHHLLHKKENGNNLKVNKIYLCPNCHRIIHWFEKYHFKYIDDTFSKMSFTEIENEIKTILNEHFESNYNDKELKANTIERMTNILLTKLIYILFYYEQ